VGVESIRRSFGRAQTAASTAGAGARRRQSPAGRSSAGDGVRREREQRRRRAESRRRMRETGARRRRGVTGATRDETVGLKWAVKWAFYSFSLPLLLLIYCFSFLLSIYTCISHRLAKRLGTSRRDYSRLSARRRASA